MSIFFKNIVGHQRQLQLLETDLANDNLAHAYLLAGPGDLGKFMVAQCFAKAVQTKDLDDEQAFQTAGQIDRGIHSDTIVCGKKPEEESIKIAEIRSLLNNLQMTGDSWKRILVIEDIDRMSTEAANAMLKMLEEPPRKVLYIFTSSNPHALLDTILSRVRKIDFQLMPSAELFRALKLRFRLEDESKIYRVVELALGRVAKAIKLLETKEHLQAYEDFFTEISGFLKDRNIASGFSLISQIHSDPVLIQVFLETVSIVLRADLKQAAQDDNRANLSLAVKRLQKLFEVKALSETNSNSRLLLENFILNL
jgi:DNA polymerase III subunit delta'